MKLSKSYQKDVAISAPPTSLHKRAQQALDNGYELVAVDAKTLLALCEMIDTVYNEVTKKGSCDTCIENNECKNYRPNHTCEMWDAIE